MTDGRAAGFVRGTTLVAGHDLRRRIRNRSAIVTAVLAPLLLAVVFSSLIGGGSGPELRVAVVDLDGSAVSRGIVDGLVGAQSGTGGSVRFERVGSADDARRRVDDGDVGAALVFAAGFGAASAGGSGTVTVVADPDQPISGQVARSVAEGIAASFGRVDLAVATGAVVGVSDVAGLAAAAQQASPPLQLADRPLGGRELAPSAYFGASMSIIFLFFTVGFAARSIHAERHAGTLDRMLATPLRPSSIVVGKSASVSVLGSAGMVVVWLVTSLLYRSSWGPPLAVLALIVATVIAIGGVATFVASLARTERQADAVTAAVTFALALVGGNFIGPGSQPPVLRTLSLFTPNGWSLRAFTALNTDAAGVADIATTLLVLLGFGLVFGGIGAVRMQRLVSR